MPHPSDRPLKNKTIHELVHLFNDKCLATKRLGDAGLSFEEGDEETLPSTFLKDPASDADIEALDSKIRGDPFNFSDGLPADYVEFLKITNGIYAHDYAADETEIFRPVADVTLEGKYELPLELLPLVGIARDVNVKWPEIDWGIQLGAGGDEGLHCIASPASIAKAVEALEQAYKVASKANKKIIEDEAKEIYGSMSNLRETKCVIVRFYHWAAEFKYFTSFKHLLEHFVQQLDPVRHDSTEGEASGDDSHDLGGDTKLPSDGRKQVPDGRPGALKGLKLTFTGTLDSVDRSTCKATVENYGGEMAAKLEDSSYVVLGVNPGPEKMQEIEKKGLKTVSEQQFLDMLQSGSTDAHTDEGDDEAKGGTTVSSKREDDQNSPAEIRSSKRLRRD